MPDPKMIPSPYLNGFFDRLLEGNNQKVRAVFEGNRGFTPVLSVI